MVLLFFAKFSPQKIAVEAIEPDTKKDKSKRLKKSAIFSNIELKDLIRFSIPNVRFL